MLYQYQRNNPSSKHVERNLQWENSKDPLRPLQKIMAPKKGKVKVSIDVQEAPPPPAADDNADPDPHQAKNISFDVEVADEEAVYKPVRAVCQSWVKSRPFIGNPRKSDFRLIREELPAIGEGEILVEGLCWTVDHYMKIFNVPTNSVMIGEQVGSVIDSRHDDFPLLTLVTCDVGWRTHAVINPSRTPVRKIIELGPNLPASLCLGTLGLPGLTAYFGLLELCQPRPGDTVLVNAAAGSVGNVVGQIAKIKGCLVVGFAGSKDRSSCLRELGFDYVFNTNEVRVGPGLNRVAPNGVDIYFDCVGSEFTEGVLDNMKVDGRICMCGYSTVYARSLCVDQKRSPYHLVSMKHQQVSTCSVFDFESQFDGALRQMLEWINQGKLKYQEILYNGFHHLPEALAALYDDTTVGKIIVKTRRAASLETIVVEY